MPKLSYLELTTRHGDFLLGADPEFRLKGIKASTIVPFEGKFGSDGPRSEICELRPDPKFTPEEVVKEFESILKFGYRTYPSIRNTPWLAGAYPDGKPCGGHIHFGIQLNGNEHILDALDKFLAPLILLLEEEEPARQRRRTDYGKLSFDFRGFDQKAYGFEYRGPASWVVSRQITKSIFSLAKVIGFEFMNKKSSNHMKIALQSIDINGAFKEAYLKCEKPYFKALVPTIHRCIRNMQMYHLFESDINYLFSLIYQDRTWESDKNMLDRWGIGMATCISTSRSKEGILKPFKFNLNDIMNEDYRWNPNNQNLFLNRFFLP